MVKTSNQQVDCPSRQCGMKCEVFTRTVGYLRPIECMCDSKQQEVHDRRKFDEFSLSRKASLYSDRKKYDSDVKK